MYCIHCGKQIDEDSIFCQFCGTKFEKSEEQKPKQEKSDTKEDGIPQAPKTQVDLLWEKFVEVYDAKDDERRKFNSLSSPFIWELLQRLSLNAYESFLEENKEELNKQSYKTIESLKDVYTWSVLGGYRLWMAEALLDEKEEMNKFKSFTLDKLIESWKKYDFKKAFNEISNDMGICITRYSNFRINGFLDSVPETKEMSNATVEKLKGSLLYVTINGYHAGKIENSFRK